MADKEVKETKEEKSVAVMDAAMFEADAGAGMSMEQDDLALPFLKVLSALDPLIQEGEIDAKPGDLYNTVTNTVYPGKAGVQVIPAHYERRFLQWAGRIGKHGFDFDEVNAVEEVTQMEFDDRQQDDDKRQGHELSAPTFQSRLQAVHQF